MAGNNSTTEFGKIKVGVKTLEDAILNLGTYNRFDIGYGRLYSKHDILRAIAERGVFKSEPVKNSAPKKTMVEAKPPLINAKRRAPCKTLFASLTCPLAILAETNLETARGMLYEDISKIMLYIS